MTLLQKKSWLFALRCKVVLLEQLAQSDWLKWGDLYNVKKTQANALAAHIYSICIKN